MIVGIEGEGDLRMPEALLDDLGNCIVALRLGMIVFRKT